MKPEDSASQISYPDFKAHIDAYPDYVPGKIQELTEIRLREVPEILAQRVKNGEGYLEKTEVTGLVEWKLYDLFPTPHPDIGVMPLTIRLSTNQQKTWHIPTQSCQSRCFE